VFSNVIDSYHLVDERYIKISTPDDFLLSFGRVSKGVWGKSKSGLKMEQHQQQQSDH
jgi:hypothetical protein